jgi:hypothetical protein
VSDTSPANAVAGANSAATVIAVISFPCTSTPIAFPY